MSSKPLKTTSILNTDYSTRDGRGTYRLPLDGIAQFFWRSYAAGCLRGALRYLEGTITDVADVHSSARPTRTVPNSSGYCSNSTRGSIRACCTAIYYPKPLPKEKMGRTRIRVPSTCVGCRCGRI